MFLFRNKVMTLIVKPDSLSLQNPVCSFKRKASPGNLKSEMSNMDSVAPVRLRMRETETTVSSKFLVSSHLFLKYLFL